MLVCGGGGYTKTSVARCWTYETAILVDQPISNDMPETDYFNFFRPTYKLHLVPEKTKNYNTPEYLENLKMHIIENIRHLPGSPSVQMMELPPRSMIKAAMKEKESTPSASSQLYRRVDEDDERDDDNK